MHPKHFITLLDLSSEHFRALIDRGIALKKTPNCAPDLLKNKVLAMLFDKSSTRTRISFETGMAQFGGSAIFLPPRDTQIGRGEPIEDSARVMSSMVDGIMLRTDSHETVVKFAEYSTVPVINGLTDLFHPCQLLADMQTFFESRGDIKDKKVAWIGDGNNMCHSYINAAKLLDFDLHIATPNNYQPNADIVAEGGRRIKIAGSPEEAVRDAHLVATDVWASMGQESEQSSRIIAFKEYQVDENLMRLTNDEALFMHCLPAHRGEEVTSAVMESPQSVVWDEAENRLHAQKALLEFLLIPQRSD